MGKINHKPGLEIIPLSERGGDNANERDKTVRMPYISDPSIVPRVQKYLETNIDKTYVDINQMADDLQRRYKEYARRKRSSFRASVKKAYSIVLQSYGLEDRESSDEDVLSDDSDDDDEDNQVMDAYNCRTAKVKQIDENELIDISSEDSEEEARHASANDKKSNGASTSQQEAPALQGFVNDRYYEKRQFDPPPQDRSKKRKLEATIMPIKSYIKRRRVNHQVSYQEPDFTFRDIGGMDKTLEEVCKLLLHITHPELYERIGGAPPRGLLLTGPRGCGKTLLANAIAGEVNVPLIRMAAPEMENSTTEESKERIREALKRAGGTHCVLLIDDIDGVNSKNTKELGRIVTDILRWADELSNNDNGDTFLIIGATNRPETVDASFKRLCRFDREISLGIPDRQARIDILKVLTSKFALESDFDYDTIAKRTSGYVGSDLQALVKEASVAAVNRELDIVKGHRRAMTQKAAEEKAKLVQSLLKKKAEQMESGKKRSEVSEGDPEIIVDDDSKSAPQQDKGDTSSEAVVVVDDNEDVITKDEEEPTTSETNAKASKPETVNGDVEEPEIIVDEDIQEAMPVDPKPQSPLDELKAWLQDPAPVSNEQLRGLRITTADFVEALKSIEPLAKIEGFVTVPKATWEEVGALRDVRDELQTAVLAPIRHPKQLPGFGLGAPAGLLLCGPPGCGKTLLANAVADEAGINFVSVTGPELLNLYDTEIDRGIRVCFERVRRSAPCVLFLDEIDAVCSADGGARVAYRMAAEMDRLAGTKGVFVLGASNRPDLIDPVLLRPGRLEKVLYVGLPSREDRVDILRVLTKNGTRPVLDPEVDLVQIGTSEQTKGYTGADLASAVREASRLALKEYVTSGDLTKPETVCGRHFIKALEKGRPSVSEKDQKYYDKLRRTYSAVPEQTDVEEMEYS